MTQHIPGTSIPVTDEMRETHDHYARNAQARGHADDCRMVTDFRNWPTIMGRPSCTCEQGGALMPSAPGKHTPHTPRTVRVPDELWAAVTVRAAERGESVSDVVRRALARYARRK